MMFPLIKRLFDLNLTSMNALKRLSVTKTRRIYGDFMVNVKCLI